MSVSSFGNDAAGCWIAIQLLAGMSFWELDA